MGDPRPINPPFSRIRFGVAAPSPAEGVAAALRPVSFSSTSLKIVHILRAPLGGLFQHVIDVAPGQIERGHGVDLLVDSTAGSTRADAILAEHAPRRAAGPDRRLRTHK